MDFMVCRKINSRMSECGMICTKFSIPPDKLCKAHTKFRAMGGGFLREYNKN